MWSNRNVAARIGRTQDQQLHVVDAVHLFQYTEDLRAIDVATKTPAAPIEVTVQDAQELEDFPPQRSFHLRSVAVFEHDHIRRDLEWQQIRRDDVQVRGDEPPFLEEAQNFALLGLCQGQ